MGIRDQLKMFRRARSTRENHRRKSLFNLVAPNQVTEQSLQVWRALPAQIRQDPSLASFQIENERLHGGFCVLFLFINMYLAFIGGKHIRLFSFIARKVLTVRYFRDVSVRILC